jgi:hypothetical protein
VDSHGEDQPSLDGDPDNGMQASAVDAVAVGDQRRFNEQSRFAGSRCLRDKSRAVGPQAAACCVRINGQGLPGFAWKRGFPG